MLYSVLFRFGHIRRSDQCAVYILYSKISTDPGLPKIRHSHRFVAVVIQFLIPPLENICFCHLGSINWGKMIGLLTARRRQAVLAGGSVFFFFFFPCR